MNMLILSLGIFYFFDAKSKNSFISDPTLLFASFSSVLGRLWYPGDTENMIMQNLRWVAGRQTRCIMGKATWRAASLSDRNMGENLFPIWPEGHCLNSAKHRPLTAWNHTWAEMRISFRGLLWSFIRHIFQPLILADTTKKLMRRTQLKQ